MNGRKFLILGNHDKAQHGDYRYFEHVFRGYNVIQDGVLRTSLTDDPHLSVLVVDDLVFCHYALHTRSDYDMQRGTTIVDRIQNIEDMLGDKSYKIIHGHLHSKTTGLASHYNVCLEHTDFYPVKLGDLLKEVQ